MIFLNVTCKEYKQMTKKASLKSKSYKTIPMAFLIGGLICVLGQLLTTAYTALNIDKSTAQTLTSVTLIFLSATLTGLNVFDNIAKVAGAGTLVPITGFANAVCAPALEFKSEGLILGLGAKLFVIAGPVITYGIISSTLYGIILYIIKLFL
ncbi:MAG: stage V sporulation protein AC [Oscillospiraceae bacterium]